MQTTTLIPKSFTVLGSTSKAKYNFYQSQDSNYWMNKPVFKNGIPVHNQTIKVNITKEYYEEGYLSTLSN